MPQPRQWWIRCFGSCTIIIVSLCGKNPVSGLSSSNTAATSTTSSNMKMRGLLSLGGTTMRDLVTQAARQDEELSSSLDLQGILWMEHVNLVVGSKPLAQEFYINVLGFTPDQGKSFHVNLGQQQFHLAENGEPAQVVAGSIGLTVPSLDTVRQRLQTAVKDTQFQDTLLQIVSDENDCITVRGPWGNIFHLYGLEHDKTLARQAPLETPQKMVHLHSEGGTYGAHRMAVRGQPGIRFLEIACPPKSSPKIAQFYRDMMGCTVTETTTAAKKDGIIPCALVCVGPGVHLCYVEHDNDEIDNHNDYQAALEAMKGVHICIYVSHFQELYQKLSQEKLIWSNPRFVHLDSCDTWEEAKASRTLRFKDIGSSNEKILELEHETRPLRHGQYLKVPYYVPK